MILMILIIVGLLFYFGPAPAILLGLALIGVGATLSGLVSSIVFRVFGPPEGRKQATN
jgi:hypothetical protein